PRVASFPGLLAVAGPSQGTLQAAVIYLALAWASFSAVKGHPTSSKAQSADLTASLLQHPGPD
ncbi:MAG TPA: hypothetical protein VIJ07_26465, partial [Dermatophilaceae bacterium]